MNLSLSFDDVLLVPADFSNVRSRKDVDTSGVLAGSLYSFPVVSSNMDSVYSPKLSQEVMKNGGASCVHRFCTIEENVKLLKSGVSDNYETPWVSVGVSLNEFERAETLIHAGAEKVVIDLANGASIQAVEQYKRLKEVYNNNVAIIVGNFATKEQLNAFVYHAGSIPDLFKVSIGSGSACTSRVVAGVGVPSFSTLYDCVSSGHNILFDGGIKSSGDIAKALAVGAKGVMMGRLFAACVESGAREDLTLTGKFLEGNFSSEMINQAYKVRKIYRGSASMDSYEVQGKQSSFRAPEGESYSIDISGSVQELMEKLSGGLRSSMSYLNAFNLHEFRENAKFVQVTPSGNRESTAHGKNS